MRFWNAFRRRGSPRRLEITVAGKWYIALTIGLGVAALTSGNNILYLIESLLLGGMILSGVISELMVSAIHLEVRYFPASAGVTCRDQILARNRRGMPLFCIEIGEWNDGRFIPMAFIPRLMPRASTIALSKRLFENRGWHRWDGLAIATSYPFGFARKVRVIPHAGERVIWPTRDPRPLSQRSESSRPQSVRMGKEIAEGEIRPFTLDDDARMIVWLFSSKGCGQFVRPRRSDGGTPEVMLDLRAEDGAEFERLVVGAARPFYQQRVQTQSGTLTLVDWNGRRRFIGKSQALHQLALARPAGRRA